MKSIQIVTTYYNCTDEFVKDYIDNLCHHNTFLKSKKNEFLDQQKISFKSQDDQTPAYGVTSYELIDQEDSE